MRQITIKNQGGGGLSWSSFRVKAVNIYEDGDTTTDGASVEVYQEGKLSRNVILRPDSIRFLRDQLSIVLGEKPGALFEPPTFEGSLA